MPDLSKHHNLLRGRHFVTVSWRVEEGGGGRFGKMARRATGTGQIDLDAMAMAADRNFNWIGAAHKFDPAPFNAALRYGGDGRAVEGGGASETIEVDFDRLGQHVGATIFGITCFNNASALAKLAELRLDVSDEQGNSIISGYRSIQNQATAALVGKARFIPEQQAWEFTEIDDTFNVNVNGNARQWRQLANPATEVLRRS